MAIQKTEGIILRRQEVRETSLMLLAFTRDLGKIQGLVKGVRGVSTAVPWFLEPITLQSLVLYERRRSPVALISSCDLLDAFEPIRRDLGKISYATYCLELVDAMTEHSDPHPEIFEALLGLLRALARGADPRSLARFLEVRLLKSGGILPDADSFVLSPGGKLSLQQILELPVERLTRLRLTQAVEEEMRQVTQGLLQGVLDRPLKTRGFLQAVGLEGSLRCSDVISTPSETRGRNPIANTGISRPPRFLAGSR